MILASQVCAVSTSHWVHENEADFKEGTLHDVVVTNLGDVKLSRAVETVLDQDPSITSVNALAQGPDGVVYAGTSPSGKLLAIKDDKVSTAAMIDGAVNISSILIDSNGAVVLGTGGENGRVLRIAKPGDKPVEIFSQKDVQYVWALQQTADGNIYAATGPNGQVFEIKPDGSHTELFKSSEDNITSMISDGKDILYLGTDPNGMVIRLNRKTKEPFILYNAGETEITALALDDGGNLYAATGEADDHAAAAPADADANKDSGRPEQQNPTTPIPANPTPAPPKPTPIPEPGEPQPIPKNPSMRIDSQNAPKMMGVMDDPGGGGDPGSGGGGDQPGGDQPGPGQNPAAPQPAENHPVPAATPPATPPAEAAQPSLGNAIYKIDPEGFVTEVFREDVVIYSMILQGQSLIVGTGGDGDVYQVNPAADETVVLATVDAKQVMCLLPLKDGRIFMGVANSGGVAAMTGGYASSGTYLSPVLDATQVSRFGKIQLHGQLPQGTSLQVATRSGNVKDSDATGWSKWSDDVDASEYLPITSPSARFLQYRLTFTTTDPSKSALVDHVDVAYQIPNLAPVVKSVKIGATASDSDASSSDSSGSASTSTAAASHAKTTAGGTGSQTITWDASDPNNDTLTYTLYFRFEQTGPWVLLKDKLKDTTFEWDTRTVADGQYQVRVVASDALSNPPGEGKTASRVSDYFIVDNTPPTIGDVDSKIVGNDAAISLRAQDRTSIVASVEYTIDSGDEWQTVLPVDGIYDSPDERVNFTLKGLTSGQHQVTIRATDSRGNQALATIVVKIESATAAGQ